MLLHTIKGLFSKPVPALVGLISLAAVSVAQAHPSWSISMGFQAPPPVVRYYQPAPQVVYVQPAPVYQQQYEQQYGQPQYQQQQYPQPYYPSGNVTVINTPPVVEYRQDSYRSGGFGFTIGRGWGHHHHHDWR
jgi:hypothetical protein